MPDAGVQRWSSGTPYEATLGYSRVVRGGDLVWVSGCTSITREGTIEAPGDPYGQTAITLRNVEAALKLAGAGLEHVVRSRVFVTDIDHLHEVGRAHREALGEVRPTMLLYEVSRLAESEMLVQIEVDAYVGG